RLHSIAMLQYHYFLLPNNRLKMTKPPANATMITGEAQSKIKNQIKSLSTCPSSYFLRKNLKAIVMAIMPTR
ncbi:hypothetical protein, partial [Streptococcus suis]|uniref:hypothetical protein n=2 Tax=Streptococcus suis TaxID=1307 RepID=UPI001EDD3ABB